MPVAFSLGEEALATGWGVAGMIRTAGLTHPPAGVERGRQAYRTPCPDFRPRREPAPSCQLKSRLLASSPATGSRQQGAAAASEAAAACHTPHAASSCTCVVAIMPPRSFPPCAGLWAAPSGGPEGPKRASFAPSWHRDASSASVVQCQDLLSKKHAQETDYYGPQNGSRQ